jgi:hypothetical protein
MYNPGHKVIIRNDNKFEVGIITAKYQANKNRGENFDVRTERGSVYAHITVDNAKSTYTIISMLTEKLIKGKAITNNMELSSIANYHPNCVPLIIGEPTPIENEIVEAQV